MNKFFRSLYLLWSIEYWLNTPWYTIFVSQFSQLYPYRPQLINKQNKVQVNFLVTFDNLIVFFWFVYLVVSFPQVLLHKGQTIYKIKPSQRCFMWLLWWIRWMEKEQTIGIYFTKAPCYELCTLSIHLLKNCTQKAPFTWDRIQLDPYPNCNRYCRPYVYTGLNGAEPIWICYPYSSGITFESDLVWIWS